MVDTRAIEARSAEVHASVDVLGVGISAITLTGAESLIRGWIETKKREYVCVCTVHTIMESRRSEAVRTAVNGATLRTPDGMPLVWLCRWAGHRLVDRVYGPDLMLRVMEQSVALGHRHFLFGGRPGVVSLLADRLRARFPGVRIVGTFTPPMSPVEQLCTEELAANINNTAADIVWVGLGTPKQDLWMARMRSLLNSPVLIAVGAAFDFHAGTERQAPRWMQRNGLEWLFRLLQEPRRLWKRYLLYNSWFVYEVVRQWIRLRRSR